MKVKRRIAYPNSTKCGSVDWNLDLVIVQSLDES